MKNFLRPMIFSLIFLVTIHSLCAQGGEVLGIVFTIKGTIVHETPDLSSRLQAGDRVYRESTLTTGSGERRAKVQLFTAAGAVIYTRFPVTFHSETFAVLSKGQQENFISSVGGTVLSERADKIAEELTPFQEGYGEEIFLWHVPSPILVTQEQIDDGFSLVFSTETSSAENGSANPLTFRLRKNDIIRAEVDIIDGQSFSVITEGKVLPKRKDGFHFIFSSFPLQTDRLRTVIVCFTSSTESERFWEFDFTVAGAETIAFMEEVIAEKTARAESDFERKLLTASYCLETGLVFRALRIYMDMGIDIEDLF